MTGDVGSAVRHPPGSAAIRAALVLLPVTAALGPYMVPIPVGGINIFAFRALVLLLLGGTLAGMHLRFWESPLGRGYVALGAVWVAWGGLSILWSPVFLPAVRDVFAILLGFGVGTVLLNVGADSRWGLDALRSGWVLAYVLTALVAVWELATGHHLESPYTASVPDRALIGVAQSTLEQPNNYGAFLLLAFPFLVWSRERAEGRAWRWVHTLLLASTPIFVILSASRLAFLGLMAEMVVFGLLAFKGRRSALPYFGLVGLVVLTAIWTFGHDPRLVGKLSSALGGEVARGGSIAMRLALTLDGLWFIMISGGLGIGAGGFSELMRRGTAPHYAGGLVDPHNYWTEIGSQYGVPILVGFIALLVALAVTASRAGRRSTRAGEGPVQFVLVGLTGYFFAAFTNSSYLLQSTNWMFVATVLVAGVHLWRRQPGRSPS